MSTLGKLGCALPTLLAGALRAGQAFLGQLFLRSYSMSRSYSYVSPPIVFLASNILAYVASCQRVIGYRDLAVPLGINVRCRHTVWMKQLQPILHQVNIEDVVRQQPRRTALVVRMSRGKGWCLPSEGWWVDVEVPISSRQEAHFAIRRLVYEFPYAISLSEEYMRRVDAVMVGGRTQRRAGQAATKFDRVDMLQV